MQIISATNLSRHTLEILDKVANQGATVAVERNNLTVPHIGPAEKKMTAHQALTNLVTPKLTMKQGVNWLKDSKAEFSNGVQDPWV